MTDAVAVTEPEEAVIVDDPVATEVTRPADETVATPVSDDAHVTTESGSTSPPESFTVALSVAVSPSDTKESELGDTSTVIVTSPTIIEADPLAEPDVAMIETDPVATAVTNPADEAVATAVLVEDHVTVAPEIVVPPASRTVATNDAVSPIDTKATELGDRTNVDAT